MLIIEQSQSADKPEKEIKIICFSHHADISAVIWYGSLLHKYTLINMDWVAYIVLWYVCLWPGLYSMTRKWKWHSTATKAPEWQLSLHTDYISHSNYISWSLAPQDVPIKLGTALFIHLRKVFIILATKSITMSVNIIKALINSAGKTKTNRVIFF